VSKLFQTNEPESGLLWHGKRTSDHLERKHPHLLFFSKDDAVSILQVKSFESLVDHFDLPLSTEAFAELRQIQDILDSLHVSDGRAGWLGFGSDDLFKVSTAYKLAMEQGIFNPFLQYNGYRKCAANRSTKCSSGCLSKTD
jgi:hypothetical protein